MNWDTLDFFFYFIFNLFDLWVILRYYDRLLGKIKKERLHTYILYFLFLLFFTIFVTYELNYANFISMVTCFCIFLPTYKGEKRNKFLYLVVLFGSACISQTILSFISNRDSYSIYAYFIPHFLFFIMMQLGIQYQAKKRKKIDIRLLILFIAAPALSLLAMSLMVLMVEQIYHISQKEKTNLLILIALLILYVNIFIFYVYDKISDSYELYKQKDEYEQQLLLQRIYYDSLTEHLTAVRKIKHDLQNHYQTMKALLNEGMTEQANAYLEELLNEHQSIQTIINTGNSGIDSILNIKFSRAQEYGIELILNSSIPAEVALPYGHCIRILGNLLDNAINALKDEADLKKVISVFLSFHANAFVIQVKNQYHDKPVKIMKDSYFHGLGLGIVKETVKLYHGVFDIEDDGKNFTVNILLYLDMNHEKNSHR